MVTFNIVVSCHSGYQNYFKGIMLGSPNKPRYLNITAHLLGEEVHHQTALSYRFDVLFQLIQYHFQQTTTKAEYFNLYY